MHTRYHFTHRIEQQWLVACLECCLVSLTIALACWFAYCNSLVKRAATIMFLQQAAISRAAASRQRAGHRRHRHSIQAAVQLSQD